MVSYWLQQIVIGVLLFVLLEYVIFGNDDTTDPGPK